jgi:glycosyltransferase involved in cell wall biosynthesis
MKILFLSPVGVLGGAERNLLTLLTTLKLLDSAPQLSLIVGTDGPLIQHAEQLGVQVIHLPLPESLNRLGDSQLKSPSAHRLNWLLQAGRSLPGLMQYCQTLRRTIRQLQPDVIHSNGVKMHLALGLLGRLKTPVFWHIHDFYGSRPVVAKLLHLAKRSTMGAIAVSQALAEDAQTILHPLPIKVVHNVVDIHRFAPRPQPLRSNPLRIGLVATFARWKGHEVFLEAAAQVDAAVEFWIVGAPIYQTQGSQYSLAELQAKARALQIDDRVKFLGFQSDMAEVYHQLDIVVHASTEPEPFGLVIVEAMACGKPVVASQAGGAAELFTHDHDAIGVPPGDPQALAQALMQLVQDPSKRQHLREQARRTAVQRYGYNPTQPGGSDRVSTELLTTYLSLGLSG